MGKRNDRPLGLELRRVLANQSFQECLGELLDLVPVGVNVVPRGVGTQAAWLVAHDLLHHEALEEAVLAVKQGPAKETDLSWLPARLLLKLREVRLSVLHVAVRGQAHREERGRATLEDCSVLSNEVGNVLHNSFAQMDGALAAYQEAARLDASVPAVHHNIGLMLMRLGRFGQAIEPFTEALRLDPGYRNARYHLSHAYTQLGRYDEAIDSWTKFLELVPGGKEALHSRAWNYMYAGQQGAAAATDARSFLRTAGWRDRKSVV